jgi:hypothetical protein
MDKELTFINVTLYDHTNETVDDIYTFYGEDKDKVVKAAEDKAREIARCHGNIEVDDEEAFSDLLDDGVIPCWKLGASLSSCSIFITWPEVNRV